ncbi:MAG TPA: aldehyde ferredoxin oxidoreductase family protein [Candidatus Methylomirabilis sp.]|nr:aldehyde ferredoxin oxidoreductase family protein [Candidatus Methylomirabilis sp.]HSC71209.1 aldehyde ferredoxin oxidoreductase family protein [Candidatus Methylomirabilis sp.]
MRGKGYVGKILLVDLATRKVETRAIPDVLYKKYLMGSGLGARLLMDLGDPAVDPLDPRNPLVIMPGMFTGTTIPGGTRTSFVSRSPLTGIWGEATVGGTWGAEFRCCGYDGLVIRGAAEKPVYLWINDDHAEIRPAEGVWGKDTYDAGELLLAETDPKAKVAAIGQAGEHLVRIASVMVEGRHARAAGRTGLGAVMGSKRLKAIVVRGTRGVPVYNPTGLMGWALKKTTEMPAKFGMFTVYGTSGGIEVHEERGGLPIKNFLDGRWPEGAAKISGKTIHEKYDVKSSSCSGCPVHCWQHVTVEGEDGVRTNVGHNPEYETLGAFGSMCLNDDLPSVIRANELCNRYGLDTISTGNSIAFAIEAFERGLISEADTGGLKLAWGDGQAVVTLVEQIAFKKELGSLLADGSLAAARKIGGEAEKLTVTVKGLEFPMHDPRAFWSMGINYATGARGACHLEGLPFIVETGVPMPEFGYNAKLNPRITEGKALLAARMHSLMAIYNGLGMCKFYSRAFSPTPLTEALNNLTGWKWTWEDLMKAGDRIFNLKRLYNTRLGVVRKDDQLPDRILTLQKRGQDLPNIPPEAFEKMLGEYYEIRGWTPDGQPTEKVLRALDLTEEKEVVFA